jgi:hypothetical protein
VGFAFDEPTVTSRTVDGGCQFTESDDPSVRP